MNDTDPRHIDVQLDDAVATITLMRPEKRNAMSLAVVQQLQRAFETLPDSVRVLVPAGAGPHFSARLDLSELSVATPQEGMGHSFAWYEAIGKLQPSWTRARRRSSCKRHRIRPSDDHDRCFDSPIPTDCARPL